MSPKQQEFVRHYCANGNATHAYIAAFGNGSKNPGVQGCKLLKHQGIKDAIEKIRGKMAEMAGNTVTVAATESLLTLPQHMARLQDLAIKAEKDQKWHAAIAAEVKRGELMGFYVQRTENTNHNYTISEEPLKPDEWAQQYAPETEVRH